MSSKLLRQAMMMLAAGVLAAGHLFAGCHEKGVNSQIFYGSKEQALREVHKLSEPLGSSRVYMLILESDRAAEIVYFENDQSNGATKIAWKGQTASNFRAQLDKVILESRGVDCAGETAKEMVLALKKNVTVEEVTAPSTLADAFLGTLDNQEPGYYRVTIVSPCR